MSERTWPENVRPTAEQFADWCVTIPREERIEVAETLLDAMDRADVCFLMNHEGRLHRLAAAEATHRDLVKRLGFGDNITEPMADNDTIVAWFEEQSRDANEWQESQLWRNDCYAAGHPDDEDCWECDPSLRLVAAEAALERVRMVAEDHRGTLAGMDLEDALAGDDEAGMVAEAAGNGAVGDPGAESGQRDRRDDEGRSGAYVDCTCGHPNADHIDGTCPFKGCGCGATYDDGGM